MNGKLLLVGIEFWMQEGIWEINKQGSRVNKGNSRHFFKWFNYYNHASCSICQLVNCISSLEGTSNFFKFSFISQVFRCQTFQTHSELKNKMWTSCDNKIFTKNIVISDQFWGSFRLTRIVQVIWNLEMCRLADYLVTSWRETKSKYQQQKFLCRLAILKSKVANPNLKIYWILLLPLIYEKKRIYKLLWISNLSNWIFLQNSICLPILDTINIYVLYWMFLTLKMLSITINSDVLAIGHLMQVCMYY